MSLSPWLADAWQQFSDRLTGGRLAHALLIRGASGTAKGELANAVVARLLCSGEGEFACGQCRSCTLRAGGAHPDFFVLAPEEGKHQIIIDRVRDLIAQLSLTASFSPRKVALIAPAEAMNANSANALLKNLEEPPGATVIVLVSHDPSRLPVTIRSRCQNLTVNLPGKEQALAWLAGTHHLSADEAAAALEAAGGSPLRALQLHEAGQVAVYSEVRDALMKLRDDPSGVTPTALAMSDIGDDQLWLWLSRLAADSLRNSFSTPSGQAGRKLAGLQHDADRNRTFARTAVRRDLLLQDWLIEWTRLDRT